MKEDSDEKYDNYMSPNMKMMLLSFFLPGFGTMYAACSTTDNKTNLPAVAAGFLMFVLTPFLLLG